MTRCEGVQRSQEAQAQAKVADSPGNESLGWLRDLAPVTIDGNTIHIAPGIYYENLHTGALTCLDR